jgi:hypothetical protein
LDQFARQLARCLYIRRQSMSDVAARPDIVWSKAARLNRAA